MFHPSLLFFFNYQSNLNFQKPIQLKYLKLMMSYNKMNKCCVFINEKYYVKNSIQISSLIIICASLFFK